MDHAPAWLTHSLIYLAAAVVGVPLSRRLGLGSIVGYLAAGIAIGPWGLGLIPHAEDVLHFAEFGVVLMLFLVGLELEPRHLLALRRPIFGWGTAQLASCAIALVVALLAVDAFVVAVDVGWRVALVASLGLALSSTAIALAILRERNLMGTDGGRAAFSILLFQDIAAIPILALLPLLAIGTGEAGLGTGTAVRALEVVALLAAIVLGGRLVLRPALRFVAAQRMTELFTAAALLLVVGIAWLMLQAGLSMALGAFLAGVLLAESEYRRELETDIEPFKGLLLGLFFIAVGMSIDFGAVARAPLVVVGLVAGFLAIKAAAVWWLLRSVGISYRERPVVTLLLAQGGEFAFVVFQTAVQVKAIESDIGSVLTASVALSMLAGPPLLLLIDRWVLPRLSDCGATAPSPETITEPQSNPVVIAGFGRYGQIIGRVALANGYECTVLDHDVQMIEAAQRFGYRVYFGDATRLDLLRMAGAGTARVIAVAVDSKEQSLAIVDLVREHFPQAIIVARALDVTHWHELHARGVQHVEREVFESSLLSAQTLLVGLGHAPDDAKAMIERFRAHNLDLLERQHPHFRDRQALIAVTRQARDELERQLAQERQMSLSSTNAKSRDA